ncbi:MAG: DUF3943 domain-containing protein [Polyangiaceae bacterium]
MPRTIAASLTVLILASWGRAAASQESASSEPTRRLQLDEPNLLVPSLHAGGLLLGMRLGEAYIWPDPFADPVSSWGEHYEAALTQPPKWDSDAPPFEWDGDPWYINVVGHGLFGSELYLRARHCRLGVVGSLLFTAAGSTVWEYGVEANGVRPSGFDLWFTPLSGVVVGEARYWAWRASGSVRQKALRGILQALFDPLGELERFAGTPC